MTNIALRNYHRNVELLIEKHDIETATSHCINILEKFPKDIETYRKLGKIFLEKPDIRIAEEIFNIILSVLPDDFVANVGLSFIAEQDKRWDDAIKFMEYAFEIQPANESLQDELKRLFKKRDGFEPPKIKLTRGALIKMYARSNLYEQAIAEIRLGLYEKPNRIDYKLTMANMLWQSGKHIEAIQTCVEVISQLSYCWEANRILYQAFLDFNTEDSDNYYQDRLVELDPYFSFMLPATKNIHDIPDIAVQLNDDISQIASNEDFDWNGFLKKTWAESPEPVIEKEESEKTDWDAILDEAISNSSAKENDPLETINEHKSSGSSKKDSFINRLQKRYTTPAEADTLEQAASTPSAGTLPEDMQSINLENQDLEVNNDLPSFPTVSDESGLVDHDAPVMDELEENKAPIAAAWGPDLEQKLPEKPSLDDTQQIRVLSDSPEEILLQSRKAIEGGNYQFALSSIKKLPADDSYLDEIRSILEKACENHPQESDLWLALGRIYQRLDLKEKALEVFIRAQKQISL